MEEKSPQKRRWGLLLLQIALAAVVVVSAVNIGRILLGYRQGSESYETIRQQVTVSRPQSAASGEEEAPVYGVDMELLLQQYPDAVGWLYCEGTRIDYPVMQAADNDYYLRRLPDGSWNMSGSLYLDWRCPADFSSGLSIIYGHNMKDGSMFADVWKYASQEWYDEHPAMTLQTPEGDLQLRVLYGFVILAQEWADNGFDDPANRALLVDWAAQHTTFSAPAGWAAEEPLVALLTCTNRSDEERYVVLCEVR